MSVCYQTSGQSMLDHGNRVWFFTQKLLDKEWENLPIPDWFEANFESIKSSLYPLPTIKLYNIYHDCGKSFCLTIDEDGRRHYPNHAEVSYLKFLEFFSDEQEAANLIKDDMVLHTGTAEDIAKKDWSKHHAFTLLVSALAEMFANVEMFGGYNSTSFKIKFKKLNRRGRLLCRLHEI